jgi:serine/threonine-protein kinase
MRPTPEKRFESAAALRQALQDFLQHRGSAQLSDQAEGRLAQIEETLALRSEVENEGEHRDQLYNLFSECRFGFRAALEAWPDNSAARSGLRRATETMVDYELDHDDPRAAAALLGELEDPPAELRERVEQARQLKARERQEMEAHAQVGRQMDPMVGRRTRAFLALVLCGSWALTPLLSAVFIQDTVKENHVNFLYGVGVLLAIATAFGFWARESLTKTVLNRRISALVAFTLIGEILLFLVTWRLGIDIVTTVVLQALYWFVLAAVATITVELRMAPAAAIYLLGLVGVLFLPRFRYYFLAMANTALMVNLVVIWWKLPRCSEQTDSPV